MTRIVIDTGLIAVTRKVIIVHPGDYPTAMDAFVTANGYAVLLAVLIAGYLTVRYGVAAAGLREEATG